VPTHFDDSLGELTISTYITLAVASAD
jgi:hypothetical protein